MNSEKKDEADFQIDLNMRCTGCTRSLGENAQRFNFFLIDTGWNEGVSKLVQKHFPRLLHNHNPHDQLFILTPEQSVEILRYAPYEIGHDPIVLVYDLYAPEREDANCYKGFRLALGMLKHPEQAMSRLQEFFRFIVMHRHSQNLDKDIRRELHREGIDGMIKILREATPEIV